MNIIIHLVLRCRCSHGLYLVDSGDHLYVFWGTDMGCVFTGVGEWIQREMCVFFLWMDRYYWCQYFPVVLKEWPMRIIWWFDDVNKVSLLLTPPQRKLRCEPKHILALFVFVEDIRTTDSYNMAYQHLPILLLHTCDLNMMEDQMLMLL